MRELKPCGTWAAYQQHKLKGEQPCDQCGEAMRAYHHTRYEHRRKYLLKRKYNLTDEDFWQMLANQDGRCAICRSTDPGRWDMWYVDHNHACCPGNRTCGKCVRGLLCAKCNVGLGNFRDNPRYLEAAIAYLWSFPFLSDTELTPGVSSPYAKRRRELDQW